MSESKKKLIRNIIIAIVVIVVLAAAVTAIVLLRKDTFGLNYFERNAVVATVGDEQVTYGEYVGSLMNYYSNIDTYNMYAMYYGSGTYYDTTTEEGMTNLKQDILDQLVYQRVYIALAKELGLELTDEERAECVKAGKDAFVSLQEECTKQAETAGAADVDSYARTLMTDYFANMGSTKNRFIAANEYAAIANKFSSKLSMHYGDERDLQDAELPDVYAEYAETFFENDYYAGAYAAYIGYMKAGQVNYPFLYIPEDFIFVRVITAADKLAADDIEEQLNSGADFEELLMSELNTDEFVKTHEHEYAIGASDSPFAKEVYTAAAELEVGAYERVMATTTAKDETTGEETETQTYYFVMRTEGTTGVIPYEQVKAEVEESLVTYAEGLYTTDKINTWTDEHAVVDTAKIAAFDPAA